MLATVALLSLSFFSCEEGITEVKVTNQIEDQNQLIPVKWVGTKRFGYAGFGDLFYTALAPEIAIIDDDTLNLKSNDENFCNYIKIQFLPEHPDGAMWRVVYKAPDESVERNLLISNLNTYGYQFYYQ